MKYTLLAFFLIFSFTLFATGITPDHTTKKINIKTSTAVWTGKKVTGEHTGTINIKDGSVEFHSGKLIAGSFTMDMNSIVCTDLREGGARKLEGHLKSDDFFGVPNHPTANFKITNVAENKTIGESTITGDLTIKGITKSITFLANISDNNATVTLTINRIDFDIKYGSGSFFDDLGDKMIYDDFIIALDLKY